MKISDVEIGKSYEYKPYGGSGRGKRAEVLETGVKLWRYDFPGVKILIHDHGNRMVERDTPARNLYRPWEEAEKEYAMIDEEERKRASAIHELSMLRIDLELALKKNIPNADLDFYTHGFGQLVIRLTDPADVLAMIDILTHGKEKEDE